MELRVRRAVIVAIVLLATATGARAQTAQPDHQASGHIFWVLPAFSVADQQQTNVLTRRQKFDLWAQGAEDPLGLAFKGAQTALEHSPTGYCGYGGGIGGYGKCYAAGLADGNISTFVGNYAFASLLHQDPRYFRQGGHGVGSRMTHSLSQVFVRRMDSGKTAVSTALIGTAVAGATSNLYYPRAQRGVGLTMSRVGWDLGSTALFNVAAEFWPDVQRHLHHKQ